MAPRTQNTRPAPAKAASTTGALKLPTIHETTTSSGLTVLAAEQIGRAHV